MIIPEEKRQNIADSISDPSTKQLVLRYGMDPETWEMSKRTSLWYTLDLKVVCGIPLIIPLVAMLVDLMLLNSDYKHMKTVL